MVWYGMVWYGMGWYGMVWYGMVWYGMVWYAGLQKIFFVRKRQLFKQKLSMKMRKLNYWQQNTINQWFYHYINANQII